MRKLVLLCLVLTVVLGSNAQYFQFSQYNFTNVRVNPANVGTTRYASLSLDSRNQKTGGDFNIKSNFLGADYPLLHPSTGQPWSGVGVTVMDDRSGGVFRTQEVSLSYAIHVRMSKYETLSLGVKGLSISRKIDFSEFFTGSQFIPDRGFDPRLSNGESLGGLNQNLFTLSSGIQWKKVDRRENQIAQFGISFFDFNQPDEGFTVANEMKSTVVADLSFLAYEQQQWAVYPELLYTFNASNHVINMGSRWQWRTPSLPNQLPARIDILTRYIVGRSGLLGLQYHNEKFSAGISYDFPLFTANAGNLGALEAALQIRSLVKTRPQKLRAKRLKAESKRRELAMKKQQNAKTGQKETAIVEDTVSTLTVETVSLDKSVPLDKKEEMPDIESTTVTTSANAGNVSIEPLIVEKVTMHFRFEFNSTDIDEDSEEFLHDLAVTLNENEALNVTIKGHTDNVGSEKFNLKLSQKRADEVKHFLIKQGIAAERLHAIGVGMSEPIADNDSEGGRARNRRVELLISHVQN